MRHKDEHRQTLKEASAQVKRDQITIKSIHLGRSEYRMKMANVMASLRDSLT